MRNKELYNSTKNFFLSKNRCFLCGSKTIDDKTAEHIFPKRLLKKFDLRDENLHLLNNTSIPYRSLTIPCCRECNNNHLNKIEKYIRKFYNNGFNKFKNIDKDKLFLWLSKIFYGIIYKESFLNVDRSKKYKGYIMSRRRVKREFQTLHFFLQGARTQLNFEGSKPYSIFIFHLQESKNRTLNFDFKDSIRDLTICIRMGNVGIIAVLQDNSEQFKRTNDIAIGMENKKLHPIQLLEFFANTTYARKLMKYSPEYVSIKTKDEINVIGLPIQKPTVKIALQKGDKTMITGIPIETTKAYPIFNERNQGDYACILSFYTGISMKKLYYPPDRVFSYLEKGDGTFNEIINDPNFS